MPISVTDAKGLVADPISDPPERAQLRETIRELVAAVSPPERTAALDEAEQFDEALYEALGGVDALAIGSPVERGGVGDVRDQLVVIEELAAGPTSMAAFMISHYAAVHLLARVGVLPDHLELVDRAISGLARISFALSEPAGGTDVGRAMRTEARRVADGFLITGQKLWTSGAAEADAMVVFARTSPIVTSAADGITMFVLATDAPGLDIRSLDTFGIHGMSTCEVYLDEVLVPQEAVLGEVDLGLRSAFRAVDREGIHAAAATLGVGRGALDLALAHARERQIFGKPLGAFQVPQHWLVDGAVSLESARGLMMRAAEIEVAGGDAANLASMAKLVASDAAVEIALKGMQLMGGLGYSREVAMQRYFRDGRLWSFSPLNNEMVRNGLGQRMLGLPRSY